MLLALLAGSAVCVVAWRSEHRLAGDWGFPLDDTWIHCQIARNLAQGHGWSYNPGVPVQNSSGPLWTALVALGFALAGPKVWVVKLLGALCFLACIGLTSRLAWIWSGDRAAATGAAFLAATSVPLAWHGLSGMETVLAALLVAATLAAHASWTSGRRRWIWPALVGLCGATRPETLILAPILAFERWRARRDDAAGGSTWWRDILVAACIAGAVLVPYFVLNVKLSGSIFPTTFAAKAGKTGLASALRNGDGLELLLSLTLYPYMWTVHTVSYWGCLNVAVLFTAAVGTVVVARGPRGTLAPGLLLLVLPALRGTAAPHVLPEIHEGRYIGCLLPALYACAAVGLAALLRGASLPIPASRRGRLAAIALAALAGIAWLRLEVRVPHVGPGLVQVLPVLFRGGSFDPGISGNLSLERLGLCLAMFVPLSIVTLAAASPRSRRVAALGLLALAVGIQFTRLPRLPRNYARNVRDIDSMDVALGRWVRSRVPPGTWVVVNDIGAIAYFGERPIVDALGLATPELTPYWSPRRLRTLVGLRRLRPSYCIIFPNWFPEWLQLSSLFQRVWELRVEDKSILGGPLTVVYRLDWDRFARFYTDEMIERLDPPEAYASLTGHLRRGMRNLGLATRARLYSNAGDYLQARGDLGRAERCFERATELDPQDTAGWSGLLKLQYAQKQVELPGRTLEAMVRQMPYSPAALEAFGQWQASVGLDAEARKSYAQALELAPDNLRLLGKAERLLVALGDSTGAAAYRSRRLELEVPAAASGSPPAPGVSPPAPGASPLAPGVSLPAPGVLSPAPGASQE